MPINLDVNKIKLDKGMILIIKCILIAFLLWMVVSMVLTTYNVLNGRPVKFWVWEYNMAC